MRGIDHSSMSIMRKKNLQHAMGLLVGETRDTLVKPVVRPIVKPVVQPIMVLLLTCLVMVTASRTIFTRKTFNMPWGAAQMRPEMH